MANTNEQFRRAIGKCRHIFEQKMADYGSSWQVLRPTSVTDQLFIKAARIRSLEIKGCSCIDEGIETEFISIVNYGVIGLIQLESGVRENSDIPLAEAMAFYDKHIAAATDLMLAKNHDYDEAWRSMRLSTYTDIILMKIHRTKQIEDNGGRTFVSEGVAANYMDMINYALFGLIQLEEAGE
ncbi:MAG: DUF1599 domain-containing protein [Tannerellaceae bacterium]|jgi:hypothetical protein|nr:DUF1599 domain-containing protein [Tannerellaceae bacterium]